MPSENDSVLLVDDDPAVRRIISKYLRRKGIPIIDVASGEEAWRVLSDRPSGIQVMITDQMMPGLTGLDLVRRVRDAGHFFPIILISGYSTSPLDDDTIEFMPKPLDLEALAARIVSLMPAQPVGI